jgi:hypothetical protein
MNRSAELIRLVQQAQRLDPVEAAFRACACLSESQRAALERRFNAVFGQCTPPLALAFQQPTTPGDAA